MAITPDQYPLLVAAPMLQDPFLDKDTGEPLSGGIVTFYKDNQRQTLKNLYYQTGTPGNYDYIPLPNPNTLTSVGTIADDGGNDTLPFYFPFDEDDTDLDESYYITVFSANDDGSPAILQFTRENFPFVPPTGNNPQPTDSQQDLTNLIPNGQFTAHNNGPNDGLFPNGDSDIIVAQGGAIGWYFTKNNTSTDTDFITFNQILQEPDDLTGNPRFSINFECAATSGNDTFKELRMRFNNVNRFASDTQGYTFSFTGISSSAFPVNVTLQIIKFFGTGGSSTQTTEIEGFTLEPGLYKQFSKTFVFGVNSSATIGTLNDDYFELAIALPATSTFDLAMTDFILTPGQVNFTDYPERPDNMVFAHAIVGSLPTPNPDGSDLYLPIVMTQGGATFDDSCIGEIVGNVINVSNKLPCDGSVYASNGYSSLGIPYRRLQSKLVTASGINIPLFGTGFNYATAYLFSSIGNNIRLTTNQGGAQSGAADGVISTTFLFSNIHTGQNIALKAYSNGSGSVLGVSNAAGTTTHGGNTAGIGYTQLVNNGVSYASFQLSVPAASTIPPGSYATFGVPGTQYYLWFTINGAGSDPAPGGTGIRINLLSTDTAQEASDAIRESISGYQVSLIRCAPASDIPGGSYWTFGANGISYSVWYKVNGVGSAPGVGVPIQVTLTGAENNVQVATATVNAINDVYFAVPDFRGMFLRGIRGSGQFDISAATRFSNISGYFGNNVGTFELDTFQSHTHGFAFNDYSGSGNVIEYVTGTAAGQLFPTPNNLTISNTGRAETQGVNAGVEWFITY